MNEENIKTLVENVYNTILSIDSEFKWYVISVPVKTWNISYTVRELHEELMKYITETTLERFILAVEEYLKENENVEELNIGRKLLNTLKSEF